uniref:Uncharacterized protein n=1 Tax=Arundo donax TaxID=35708 RepID=A0A0A9FNX7_ARUDO
MTQTLMVTLSARTFPSTITIAASPSSFPDPSTTRARESGGIRWDLMTDRETGGASPGDLV